MRVLQNTILLIIAALIVVSVSLYADWCNDSFTWFQRSGSFLVLVGAILGYRSIVRLGKEGVGGSQDTGVTIHKVHSSYEKDGRRMIKIIQTPENKEHYRQISLDKIAGYSGALLAVSGTIIWGYGDLLGAVC